MEDIREIFETITMTDSIKDLDTIIQWCEDRKEDIKEEKYITLLNALCDIVGEIAQICPYEETPVYDDYCVLNWQEVFAKFKGELKEKQLTK